MFGKININYLNILENFKIISLEFNKYTTTKIPKIPP